MAWDLWSSSCDLVANDDNYSEHPGWQCDFYFGCRSDAIEEVALNMESCVQVLRILITKADSEIEELEKDLLSLQNELAWAENDKWPEICCSALTERINWLDTAVSTLKNDHADDTETQLLLHSKPAETLHEIVKALQRDHCQDTHGQHLDGNIFNPIVNVSEQALVKDSSNIDSNIIIKEEGKELCGASEHSRSPEFLLELHEKRSDEPEKTEELLAKSLVKSPDLGPIGCAPDDSDGIKLSETSDNRVTGNEEVRRHQLITKGTGQLLNLFSFKGNGNIPSEAKKENATVIEKDVSSDDFGLATGLKGRKKYLHSRLHTSEQRKNGNSDLDEKLCDFVPKTARRACKKESKVATDEDLNSLRPLQVVFPKKLCLVDTELCSFKGSNGGNSRQVMKIQNTSLIHGENSALISLLGVQTKRALYSELQLTGEEKSQAQGLEPKIAANISKPNMSFPSKLKAQGKTKPELEAFSAREPRESTEVIPSTSIILSTKRQRKSKTCTYGDNLKESINSKITKRAVQPGQHETEARAIVLYDSKFSEFQKKGRVSKLPITVEIQNSTVNLELPNSDGVSMENGSQVGLHTNKSISLVDSQNETSANDLKKLTLSNLRALAKQHKVRKYYKLPKGALVELLVERLSSC